MSEKPCGECLLLFHCISTQFATVMKLWLPLPNLKCITLVVVLMSQTNEQIEKALLVSGSQQVVELWTIVCESLEVAEGPSIDLNGGGDHTKSGRMFRKCFYDYERYLQLHESLQENLKKTLDVLGVMPAECTSQQYFPTESTTYPVSSTR